MVYLRRIACSSLALSALTLFSLNSVAHVSVTSGPATAGGYYEVTLAVSHGCDGDDTYKVEVTIPGTFGRVRATASAFGPATVETVTDGTTVSSYKVTWEKSGVHENDDISYNIGFRTKLPDTPFATVYLPAVQYCRDDETQDESISAWVGTSGSHDHGSTSTELPAPALFIYPARYPGWNQYQVNEHVHDLSVFDDAEIVWFGTSAYSSNPNTRTMLEADPDTSALEQIHPGSEIWVKY
jgi:uncharacterized protein YcnI